MKDVVLFEVSNAQNKYTLVRSRGRTCLHVQKSGATEGVTIALTNIFHILQQTGFMDARGQVNMKYFAAEVELTPKHPNPPKSAPAPLAPELPPPA